MWAGYRIFTFLNGAFLLIIILSLKLFADTGFPCTSRKTDWTLKEVLDAAYLPRTSREWKGFQISHSEISNNFIKKFGEAKAFPPMDAEIPRYEEVSAQKQFTPTEVAILFSRSHAGNPEILAKLRSQNASLRAAYFEAHQKESDRLNELGKRVRFTQEMLDYLDGSKVPYRTAPHETIEAALKKYGAQAFFSRELHFRLRLSEDRAIALSKIINQYGSQRGIVPLDLAQQFRAAVEDARFYTKIIERLPKAN